jgi:hypothetical protein
MKLVSQVNDIDQARAPLFPEWEALNILPGRVGTYKNGEVNRLNRLTSPWSNTAFTYCGQ